MKHVAAETVARPVSSTPWLAPGSVSGFPGDQTQFSFFEVKEDCFGNPLAPVARNATWSSTDPSVATCDAMGMATGQLPGFTYIQGRWRTFLWDLSANQTCTRTVYDALAEALCAVLARRVDDVSPARALIGQPVDVTITGSGFGTGTPTVEAGSGITVSNVSLVSGSEVHARFTIASNATPGNHSVSVRTSFGQPTTISGNFFVQVPTSLQVLIAGFSSSVNGCPTNQPYGTRLRIRYQVRDQLGGSIVTTIPIRENLLNLTIDGVGNSNFDVRNGTPTASGATEGDGSFVDNPVGVCSTTPGFQLATFTQELFVPLETTTYTIRTNGFSLAGRNDCGDMTNSSDIDVKNCP